MDVRLPDGTVVTNVPDGITQSELMARVGKSAPTPAAAPKRLDTTPTWMERNVAPFLEQAFAKYQLDKVPARGIVQGAADAPVGTTQLLTGGAIDPWVKEKEAEYQAQRGSKDFDWARLAGNVIGPANLLAAGPAAVSTAGRIVQGMKVGGMSAATNPLEDFSWADKAGQVGFGTALGGVIPAGWEGAKLVGRTARNVIDPSLSGGLERAAGRMYNVNAGDKREEIIKLLMNAKSEIPGAPITAGQAATPANRAEFAAMQEMAKNANPSLYAGDKGVEGLQEAARRNLLQTVAQSGTNAKKDALRQLNEVTGPMREQALKNANVAGVLAPRLEQEVADKAASKVSAMRDAGQMATGAAQQEVLANKFTPVPGMPRVAARVSNNLERVPELAAGASDATKIAAQRRAEEALKRTQLNSLAESGHEPLKADSVTGAIDAVLKKPGLRASDMVEQTLGAVREKIAKFTNDKGVIDANDLYTIRKEVGSTIKTMSQTNQNWDKRLTAKLETDVKGYIDDAIEKAGGDNWKKYLATHAEGMKPVNDITIARELEKSLTSGLGSERAASFGTAVKNATLSEDLLRPSGAARYGNISEAMTPRGSAVVDSLMANLTNEQKYSDLAKAGMSAASKNIGVVMPEVPATGAFNPKLSVARALINRVVGKEHGKVLEKAGEMGVDPARVAQAMKNATPMERQLIVDELMKLQAAGMGQQP